MRFFSRPKKLEARIEALEKLLAVYVVTIDALEKSNLDALGEAFVLRNVEHKLKQEVEALTLEVQKLNDGPGMRAIRSLRGDCTDLMAERDQLKAENEALRKDAERFAYIERDADSGMSKIYGDDWVAVIDAAMGKGEQS